MRSFSKVMLLALGLSAALQSSASINSTGKTLTDTPDFLNQQFCSNKQVRLVMSERNEDYRIVKFTILDDRFNKVTDINIPEYPEVTATYTVSEALTGPLDVFERYRQENPEWPDISLEEFIERARYNGFTRQEKHGEEVWMLYENQGEYFYPECFGYKYPRAYYIWRNNVGYTCSVDYGYENWGFTGIYGEAREESESARPQPMELYPSSPACLDIDDIVLSQTLFNTDDLYEYVIPVLEAVDCSYKNEYEKVEGQKVRAVGFKVVSQNGAVVSEVRYPAGYYSYGGECLDLYIMDDVNYLLAEVRNEQEERYHIVYEINPKSASLSMVSAPRRVSVSPATPVKGTDVTVDLGEAAGEDCLVNVVSASGRAVMSIRVEPGANGTRIDTGRLERGLYIVTVNDGKNSREATKIVVR